MIASLQGVCIVLVSLGVAVELVMGADLGYLLITIGALSFAVATKIHSLEERARERKHNGNKIGVSTDANDVP